MEQTRDGGIGSVALVERKGEMAIAAMAAKAKAEVEAKYVIALNRPRKPMEARATILDACKRERFAEAARYKKPVGKKQVNGKWEQQYVEGFSIRFAEVAVQAMKNISVETTVVWEDDERRTIHVAVTDLESNLSYGEDITISKTVERRSLKEGQEKVGERINSYGDKVYIVIATDDELANKIAAQRSKIIRNSGLRLVPQDFLDEASDMIEATLSKGGTDPKAETKKIADAFGMIGVGVGEIEKYLNHSLETLTKKELADLRAVYQTIRDGEASWSDYCGESVPRAEAQAGPGAPLANVTTAPFRPKTTAPAKTTAVKEEKTQQAQPPAEDNVDMSPPNVTAQKPAPTEAPKPSEPEQSAATPTTKPPVEAERPAPSEGETITIPPPMTPSNWLPVLDAADAAGVLTSLREWLGMEEITEEEMLALARKRGWAKGSQKLADLSTNKLTAILRNREKIRSDIITDRSAK